MLSDLWIRFAACVATVATLEMAARAQCHTWSTEFGTSLNGKVYAMQVFDDGTGSKLWVGGDLGLPGIPSSWGVARWDGHAWAPTGYLDDRVTSLAVLDDGTGPSLYAGGWFYQAIARWNGSTWVSVGGGLLGPTSRPQVDAMATYDAGNGARLYVTGAYLSPGGSAIPGYGLLSWDGHTWFSSVGSLGTTGNIKALHVFDDGSGPALYAGGPITSASGAPASGVARWNGSSWSAVGSEATNVFSFATFDDGSGSALYASGLFYPPGGGTPVGDVRRWNGTSWNSAVGVEGSVMTVCDVGDGPELFADGGYGQVKRSNGQTWWALGDAFHGQFTAEIHALATFDEGDGHGPELFVGGEFTTVGGGISSRGIAKWITCHLPIETFCPGDATLAHCPCSNTGQGGRGCNNSIGTGGAALGASGTTNPDTLVLTSQYELPHALSIFLQGDVETQFVQPFGDGLRCVGGQLLRLYVKNAQNGAAVAPRLGDPSISARSAALGSPIAPGSRRYYQVYYRDPDLSFCSDPTGSAFNASNGVRVVW